MRWPFHPKCPEEKAHRPSTVLWLLTIRQWEGGAAGAGAVRRVRTAVHFAVVARGGPDHAYGEVEGAVGGARVGEGKVTVGARWVTGAGCGGVGVSTTVTVGGGEGSESAANKLKEPPTVPRSSTGDEGGGMLRARSVTVSLRVSTSSFRVVSSNRMGAKSGVAVVAGLVGESI